MDEIEMKEMLSAMEVMGVAGCGKSSVAAALAHGRRHVAPHRNDRVATAWCETRNPFRIALSA
jgi:hypothetical protein